MSTKSLTTQLDFTGLIYLMQLKTRLGFRVMDFPNQSIHSWAVRGLTNGS